jgi:dipeptidyl-peptidase 4
MMMAYQSVARRNWRPRAGLSLLALLPLLAAPVEAQTRAAPAANWELANRFDTDNLRLAVRSTNVQGRWIHETDSLWYRWETPQGAQFTLVVPASRTKRPLFDHVRLAADLSAMHGKPYDATNLPFNTVDFEPDGRRFRFRVDSTRYRYDLGSGTLSSLGTIPRDTLRAERRQRGGFGGGGGFGGFNQNRDFRNYAPDSTVFAFAREHNLYIVDVATGDTTQISTDGVEHYSFGARDTTQQQQQQQDDDEDDLGGGADSRDPRVRANVTWSPDSRAFVVTRNDQRKVSELYLVDALSNPRPRLVSYRYSMPGEENVAQVELYRWTRGDSRIAPVDVSKWKDQRLFNIHWTTGSDKVRLTRRDRLQRNLELIEVALPSNDIRVLLTERVENAYLESQAPQYAKAGGDFVWWSERTGWGHYYLYDHDGNLKRPLTSGDWRADSFLAMDTLRRTAWITGFGREPGENVYYRHTYRVHLDQGGPQLLDEGEAEHQPSLSPSRRWLLDNHSRIDRPSEAVLRDASTGAVVMALESFDTKPLEALGWKPPEQFRVKAADGVTDIYGNMWKPFDFDSTKSYPIIAHVYPGPQTEQVTTTFSPTAVQQRLAQLGFIVIQIGNRGGSPRRSNAYHSYGYYNLRDYGLADKKAGIEQLAARHSWINIDRVGIYGHSGGGFMTAAALLLPPYNDFFKVGVSSAGNHDNNVYNQNWSEQHHGLREVRGNQNTRRTVQQENGNGQDGDAAQDDSVRFDIKVPANHELAENLKHRLLLVHGDMDNNVHPAGTVRLADALIRANKRFDYMVMPGKAHGFANYQPYFTRLMMEYFAEHLIGDYYREFAEIK